MDAYVCRVFVGQQKGMEMIAPHAIVNPGLGFFGNFREQSPLILAITLSTLFSAYVARTHGEDIKANQEDIKANQAHIAASLDVLRANQSSIDLSLTAVKAQQAVLEVNQKAIDANREAIESMLVDLADRRNDIDKLINLASE